jgi:lysophospholipase L1-like esterase
MTAQHVVLLGDSILDNRPYTTPEPGTAELLQSILGEGWSVELAARDGATMHEMPHQLRRDGGDGGTAVLSIGGNDVTSQISLLSRPVSNAATVFAALLDIAEDFGVRYEDVARAVAGRFQRTVLCTIYEVQLEPPPLARLARVPLAVLNDRIIRVGARLGLEVLELRDVCTEPSDFVLQIEPSPAGAARIAEAIAGVLRREAQPGRIHSGS